MRVWGAGLVWLFLARTLSRPELLYPYAIAFAANLAIIALARLKYDYPWLSPPALLATSIAKGWLILFVPLVLISDAAPADLAYSPVARAGAAPAALVVYTTHPRTAGCPTRNPRAAH